MSSVARSIRHKRALYTPQHISPWTFSRPFWILAVLSAEISQEAFGLAVLASFCV